MILVTSAGGKTGRAMIAAFAAAGEPVRAMLRRADADDELRVLGAAEIVHGDLTEAAAVAAAAQGCRAIYYICPNMTEDEKAIGDNVIAAAQAAGTGRSHTGSSTILRSRPRRRRTPAGIVASRSPQSTPCTLPRPRRPRPAARRTRRRNSGKCSG